MERDNVQAFNAAEQLEAASHNAHLDKMHRRADTIEKRVDQMSLGREERATLMWSLNKEWAYTDQEIIVTGIIMSATTPLQAHKPEYIRRYAEDQPAISTGFVMIPFASNARGVKDDEASISNKIAYSFMLDNQDIYMLRHECLADFPNDTVEAAERQLLYFHNEELVRIQQLLEANHPSIEPVLALSDYTLKVQQYDMYGMNYVADMESYLNAVVPCDSPFPYMTRFDGSVYEKTDEGCALVASTHKDLLVQPEGVRLFPNNEVQPDKSVVYDPYVEITVFHADRKQKNTTLFVPIKQVEYLTPIRARFK